MENLGLILTRVVDVEIMVFASAVQCLLIDRSQHGRLVRIQHKCSHQHRIIPGCTLGALDGDGGKYEDNIFHIYSFSVYVNFYVWFEAV